MLDDILFSTQLLITHSVMTFSGCDNHDIFGIYLAYGPKEQALTLCLTRQTIKADSHAPHSSHDYRDYHRLKMLRPSDWPRVGCTQCHQAYNYRINCLSLTSDHHRRARAADMILSWLCQLHFAELITVKKNVMTKWPTSRWSQKCHKACINHTNRVEYHPWSSQ